MSEENKETITLTLDPESEAATTVLTEPILTSSKQEIEKPSEPLADIKIDPGLFNEQEMKAIDDFAQKINMEALRKKSWRISQKKR